MIHDPLISHQTPNLFLITFLIKTNIQVLELVDIEIRELLEDFGLNGNESPVIYGSALDALNGKDTEFGEKSIHKLLAAMDEYIPNPERDLNSPFLVPIDNLFSVRGRGTVVVGTIQRGVLKQKTPAEFLGFNLKLKTVISDIQVFKKSVPQVNIHNI